MKQRRISNILILSFSIIHILTMIGFIIRKNYNYFTEALFIYIFFLVFIYFQRKKEIYLKNYLLGLVVMTLIGHSLIGEFLNLYNISRYYDKLLHFLGAFSFSLFYI